MDVLRMIRDGELSKEQADDLFDETIRLIHEGDSNPDWRETLELTNHESTAISLGALLSDLVAFRYQGWPERCAKCGQPLDYLAYGWFPKRDSDGALTLVHLECPS